MLNYFASVLFVQVVIQQPVHGGHIFREHCAHVGVGGLGRQLQVLQVTLHRRLGWQRREARLIHYTW